MGSAGTVQIKANEKVSLETVAKSITYALPLVYVCGFVILSLHEAQYGIADLSLIRVKALAAGLLFVIFLVYPSLVSIRFFELLGLKKPGSTRVQIGDESNIPYFYVIKISELYVLSVFGSMGLSVFFTHRPRTWMVDIPTPQFGPFSLLTFLAGITGFGVWLLGFLPSASKTISKHFASKPGRCVLLVSLISVLWLIWTFEMSDRLFFNLVGWFYLVCRASVGNGESVRPLR